MTPSSTPPASITSVVDAHPRDRQPATRVSRHGASLAATTRP